jgi:signal transduction histidine kinase
MPSEVSTAGADQHLGRVVDELKRELEAKSRELAEAREQQAATAGILASISSSPADLRRVCAEIAANAARLCDAYDALIAQMDGDSLCLVAHHGPIPTTAPVGQATQALTRGLTIGRAILDRQTIHVSDLQAEPGEYPQGSEIARRHGIRTSLVQPLMRENVPIGVINIRRTEVRAFTEKQIELLKVFADQAVIAIENTRLFEAEQARTNELTASLEYQTALADVLGIISRSPSNVQPVLDAIAASARRLCAASDAVIERLEADRFYNAAHSGTQMKGLVGLPLPLTRQFPGGRAVLDRKAVIIDDIGLVAESEYPDTLDLLKLNTIHSVAEVPLLSEGRPLGSLAILRAEVRPFTNKEIAMLDSFASQAVIAIENARLFEAEQASKRELQESLEYQTAISDVLNVISRSPTDVQPVFDMIAESAMELCHAEFCNVFRFDGQLVHFVASHGTRPEARRLTLSRFPVPPGRGFAAGRAILSNAVEELPDVNADADFALREIAKAGAYGSIVAVPMKKDGSPIGALAVGRSQVGPFPNGQIELLKTFADQAVIAIENTRLFEAEQTRTRELTEALEQQTATADVLKVISRSALDLQRVLDALVESAARLCNAYDAVIFQVFGDGLRLVAHHGQIPTFGPVGQLYPLARGRIGARAVLDRRTIHITDILAEADEYPENRKSALHQGYRTALAVPLVHAGEAIGVIVIRRAEVRPFTERHIELVNTFADQAVIAIENARLFEAEQTRTKEVEAKSAELRESLEYQTATSEVLKVISRSAFELRLVMDTLVESAARLCDADAWLFRRHGDAYHWAASYGFSRELHERIKAFNRQRPLVPNRGTTSMRAALEGRPVHIVDVLADPEYNNPEQELVGFRTTLAVPLQRDGIAIGVLTLTRSEVRPFTDKQIELLTTFADQAVIAIENARLFEEVQARTRELAKTVEDLEIASQHKSQFVANMSHELRTPLAAILGYAELMQEGFYEAQGPKSLDALTRIRSNGKHLLGLINTVLDIAKIESGQFTLNMAEYAIESVVETVRSATESLAQNKKLALKTEVAKPLPIGLGDEQRLTQVLLNLVGNAIKFTDAGEVRVTAKAVNGHFNVTVVDTGPGIPPAEQSRIFEQFHQVDSSLTKAKGGTGLGLAIAKQIVEMHGGRIWVESTVGKGSTFQMEIPTRAELRKLAL